VYTSQGMGGGDGEGTDSVAAVGGEHAESHDVDSAFAGVGGIGRGGFVLTAHCAGTDIPEISFTSQSMLLIHIFAYCIYGGRIRNREREGQYVQGREEV